jgi:hypothetical protein
METNMTPTERKAANKIATMAMDLINMIEDFPQLTGYADNEAGEKALKHLCDELFELGYSAEQTLEEN